MAMASLARNGGVLIRDRLKDVSLPDRWVADDPSIANRHAATTRASLRAAAAAPRRAPFFRGEKAQGVQLAGGQKIF